MISAIESAELRIAARPGALRRLAPVAALVVLLALAFGFEASHDAQYAVSQVFSASVRRGVAAGDLVGLAQAAAAFALWLLWLLARQLAFFAAFLLAELLLLGPPKSWRAAGFALAVQTALGVFYYLVGPVLDVALPLPLGAGPLLSIEQARLEAVLGPTAQILVALAALFVFDLVGYWYHRAQHFFPLLWRFHAVHHSIDELDSLSSYLHPLDLIGARVGLMAFSLLVGFEYGTVLWLLAFQTVHERFLHTRAPINFGVLGGVLIDNRTHFVHHTRIDARAGSNFATIFTIFDRMFGTYNPPHRDALGATGLGDRLPPRTLLQFVLGRLDERPPPEAVSRAPTPAGDCRPSA